jgi:hypothetical protein
VLDTPDLSGDLSLAAYWRSFLLEALDSSLIVG